MQQKSFLQVKGVECEVGLNWYQVKCGDIFDTDYQTIAEIVWYCKKCISSKENEAEPQGVKHFPTYMDDIVTTVKGVPEKVLQSANRINPHLQITIEAPNSPGDLAFLDFEININRERRMSCGWYQ